MEQTTEIELHPSINFYKKVRTKFFNLFSEFLKEIHYMNHDWLKVLRLIWKSPFLYGTTKTVDDTSQFTLSVSQC